VFNCSWHAAGAVNHAKGLTDVLGVLYA